MGVERRDVISLVVALVIPLVVGGIGGFATTSSLSDWYRVIERPSWTPPDWIFGPVWTFLYLVIGVASWLVWRQGWDSPGVRGALSLFGVQLILNLLWSVIFFGLRSPSWALLEIVVLWVMILLTMVQFYRLNTIAGLLFVPYQLWVTFATALNAAIWWLNR